MGQQGHTADEFLRRVIYELDAVHRARIEGTQADGAVVKVVADMSLADLEMLIESLTRAVDGGYASPVTGAKVALTRILEHRKRAAGHTQASRSTEGNHVSRNHSIRR
jgi:hypothetical protein